MKKFLFFLLSFPILFFTSISNAQPWSTLGNGIDGGNGTWVSSITSFNGNIIAGGAFASAGGVSATNVAMWNGTGWQAMSSGLDGEVLALAVYNNELYAGGTFTSPSNYIAKWNGSSWVAVSGLTNGGSGSRVNDFLVDTVTNRLYIGGDFSVSGGNNVAFWNGSTMTKLTNGNGFQPGPLGADAVLSIAFFAGDLYAGGVFRGIDTDINPIDSVIRKIGKWNGTKWDSLSQRMSLNVNALVAVDKCDNAYYPKYLYIGGEFTSPGSQGVTRWDSSNYIAAGNGVVGKAVYAIDFYHNEVYAGGQFNTGLGSPYDRIIRWNDNDSVWKEVNDGTGNGLGGSAFFSPVFVVYSDGQKLYVGGQFDSLLLNGIGTKGFHHIAVWETPAVDGCTEKIAANYNPLANVDDCSCIFPCSAKPFFSFNDTTACINDTLFFTNTSIGASSYEWQVDGLTVTTSTNYVYFSSTPGTHIISLIAKNSLCQDTLDQTIIITASTITPTLTITPNDTVKICSGELASFSVTSTGGGSNPTYQWNMLINGPGGTDTTTYSTPSMSSDDCVFCLMTSNANCANPLTVSSDTICIDVESSASSPTILISPSDTTICPGQIVSFNSTITNGGLFPTYQWYLNGSPVSTNPAYTTPQLFSNATVKCVMHSSSTCAVPDSAVSITTNITISGTVVIPGVSISPLDTSNCIPVFLNFTATPDSNQGTSPTYEWFVDGISVGTGPTYSATFSNNAQVFCIMTSNAPCANPTSIPSDVTNVTVGGDMPIVTISPSGTTTICPGDAVSFISSNSGGGTAPTYEWFLNGVSSGAGSTYTTTAIFANSSVFCVMTSNSPCAITPTDTSLITTINIGTLTPTISISTPTDTICPGDPITFTASTTNGGTTPTFQWFLNGLPVGTNDSTFTTTAIITNSTVFCMLISSLSCANPDTVNSAAKTIITGGSGLTPSVSINPTDTTICSGQNITFTALPVNGGASPIYQWFLNGNPVGTNAVTYSNSALNNNDSVYCQMISSSSCSPSDTVTSAATGIDVRPAPVANAGTDTTITAGSKVQLNACCGNSYLWTPSTGLNNPNIANPIATPDQMTTYTVAIADSFNCNSSDDITIFVTTGLFIPNMFSPNGDGKNDVFKLYGYGIKEINFKVFNRLGNLVWEASSIDEAFNIGWDGTYKGKLQPNTAYVWYMQATYPDGNEVTFNGKTTGTILLTR